MRKVKRSAASYLRVGNASEVFKSPANFIKKFGALGHERIRFRYIIYEKSSAAEKELLNLVGLTDSARQFKWNYMISERDERLNDLPLPQRLAHNVTPRLIYIETSRIPQMN